MRQDELSPAPGSKKGRKRVGRGNGSGHGTYCGRGCKGQKSRSSVDLPRGFEGGQLPISKRMPHKRGFTNIFRTEYNVVNVGQLNSFESGSEVTAEKLFAAGLIASPKCLVKVLGDGDIDRPLTVKASRFSATAKTKIQAAGGKIEEKAHATEAS